jgi:hypothetical protein
MYTLCMSWSARALALMVVLTWGLAPQLACFMPDETLTPAEMDCCQKMANDCGAANMSDTCCRPAARTDIGITAKTIRNVMPRVDTAGKTTNTVLFPALHFARELSNQSDHAPPDPSSSFVILRI